MSKTLFRHAFERSLEMARSEWGQKDHWGKAPLGDHDAVRIYRQAEALMKQRAANNKGLDLNDEATYGAIMFASFDDAFAADAEAHGCVHRPQFAKVTRRNILNSPQYTAIKSSYDALVQQDLVAQQQQAQALQQAAYEQEQAAIFQARDQATFQAEQTLAQESVRQSEGVGLPVIDPMESYFREYAFYEGVEMFGTWGTHVDAGVSQFSTSDGRAIRALVDEHLATYEPVEQRGSTQAFFASVNAAFAEVAPHAAPMFSAIAREGEGSKGYQALRHRFDKMVGTAIGPNGLPEGPDLGGRRLPISPYDPRWSDREVVRVHGTKLLSLSEESVGMIRDLDLATIHLQDNDVYEGTHREDDTKGGVRPLTQWVNGEAIAWRTITENDQMRLPNIGQFMTAKEYRAAASWLRAGLIDTADVASQKIDPNKVMSDEGIARSEAILTYLSDEGVDFRIEPDREPGQLKVRIEGTRIDIRLTDTRANEQWVGRVYDSGTVIKYSAEQTAEERLRARERMENGDGTWTPATDYEPSPTEVVDLVKFALGREVERQDGKGLVGVPNARHPRALEQAQDAYFTKNRSAFMVREGLSIVQDARDRSAGPGKWFDNEAKASEWLGNNIALTRARVAEELGVEELIALSAQYADDPDFMPAFAGEDELMAIKQDYWAMLRGEETDLLNPGVNRDDYMAAIRDGDHEQIAAMTSAMNAVTVEDRVRQHAALVLDDYVGTVEPDPVTGLRFNPVTVAQHMPSAKSLWSNHDDIIAALRATSITGDELRGDEFYNDVINQQLLKFNPETAQKMVNNPDLDPQLARFGTVIAETISRNGADVVDIAVDDNGVVRWTAQRRVGAKDSRAVDSKGQVRGERTRHVQGEIGQIFTRGEHGEIVTKFNGGENYMFAPGYTASVVPQKPGETKSLEERTKLKGYEQVMSEALVYRVREDLMFTERSRVGATTSINSAYKRLYDNRFPVDFFERSAEEGLSDEWRAALLETASLRVHYDNSIRDGANVMEDIRAQQRGFDARNDNSRDALVLTGGRNISVLDVDAGKGFFDPMMTGMAANQGSVRYLLPSAKVGADGMITPGDPADRVPVAAHPESWAMGFDPHDRQNMTFSNIMQASAVTGGARTAMIQLGGWNFEDGIIVSADFANTHVIRDTEDEMRPLVAGDKLSDFHGNKGVIALVVDPAMSDADARAAGLESEVAFFRDNPDLEVVMSPFSAISRFNGGTARELMNNPQDVVFRNNDGSTRVQPGASGDLNFIVTHMAVDAKTNVYDEEAVREGQGRKASSQLAWVLQAQECHEIMEHFYGNNVSALANFQEYLRVTGLDVTPYGELREGFSESNEQRNIIEMPSIYDENGELNNRVNRAQVREAFVEQISRAGGVMEIPFQLQLRNGAQLEESPNNPDMYQLPLLSPHLRSDEDLADGSTSRHEYTTRYMAIFDTCYKLAEEQAKIDALRQEEAQHGTLPRAAEKRLSESQKFVDQAQKKVQASFDGIANDIVASRIETKNNVFKDGFMSARQSHSATAVWTGDPRLSVDEVAMNSSMARELGVLDNGYAMVWRDPVIRDGGVRYLRVVINDDLHGVAVNPVSVKSFDGDFDGDSVGLVGNLPKKAHEEALSRLTVEANMLDLGDGKRMEDGTMFYGLTLHDSLDVQVAQHHDPAMAENMKVIVSELNRYQREYEAGEISREELLEVNRAHMDDLNEHYAQAFANRDGLVTLRFDGMENHMASVAQCFETGAKGSPGKLKEYATYIGADPAQGFKDVGQPTPEALRSHYEGSQKATAIKVLFTGVAGKKEQEMVALCRNLGLTKEAMAASAPAQQSILQAKHDPIDALYRAETLMGPVGDLYQGRKMRRGENEQGRYEWEVVRDENHQPIQATKDEWVQQYMEMYADDKGMGVSVGVDQVEKIAEEFSDEQGYMRVLSHDELPTEIKPLALDQLAYGDKKNRFDLLCEMAKQQVNIYDGDAYDFAPRVVRANMKAMEDAARFGIPDVEIQSISAQQSLASFERVPQRSGFRIERRVPAEVGTGIAAPAPLPDAGVQGNYVQQQVPATPPVMPVTPPAQQPVSPAQTDFRGVGQPLDQGGKIGNYGHQGPAMGAQQPVVPQQQNIPPVHNPVPQNSVPPTPVVPKPGTGNPFTHGGANNQFMGRFDTSRYNQQEPPQRQDGGFEL